MREVGAFEAKNKLAGFLHDLPVKLDADTAGQAWVATSRLPALGRVAR
jgi:hypothetical protein